MKTLPELIARMRKDSPAVFGKLDDKVVTRVLRTAFATVAQEVGKAPDGIVKVGGLGSFRVRTVEPKEGAKGDGRRVVFQPAAPKAPKAGKTAKAGADEE